MGCGLWVEQICKEKKRKREGGILINLLVYFTFYLMPPVFRPLRILKAASTEGWDKAEEEVKLIAPEPISNTKPIVKTTKNRIATENPKVLT